MVQFEDGDKDLQKELVRSLNLSYQKDDPPDNLEDEDPDAQRGIVNSFKEYCPACKHTTFVATRMSNGLNALRCKKCGQVMPLCPSCNHLTLVPHDNGTFKCRRCSYIHIPFGKP